MEYLDFELPIKELMEQYQTCSLVGEESGVDMKPTSQIEDKIIEKERNLRKSYALAKSSTITSSRQTIYIRFY